MSNKVKKIILSIMAIIFLSLFFYSLYHIIIWVKDNKETSELTDSLINDYVEIVPVEETDNGNEEETIKEDKLVIDFENLSKRNKDTKGWLIVDGTNINYPFVQSKDNKYYLNHNFDKKYTDAGWVFMDYRNDINNLNKNTIIYAHARKDRTMFGSLRWTFEKNWQNDKSKQIIKIITQDKELLFETFSTYHIKTEDYYITTNFNSDDDFMKFANTLKNRSNHNYKVDLSKDDYILTLSTCYTESEKVVLHARLIKND